ncbi:MAG: DUF2752 domain-containing protein [Planctomycetota bacterium]|nr:DUF2752 domain-containing protein [Planctomycetota bacterium]
MQGHKLAIAGAMTLLAVPVVVVFWTYDPSESSFFPKCLFHVCTGLHCPGCGVQRAVHRLLHGDLIAALRFNAMVVLALPFLGYSCVAWTFDFQRLLPLRVSSVCHYIVLAGTIVFWIARNIPIYPFLLLRPN